jgi:hypothetical protein
VTLSCGEKCINPYHSVTRRLDAGMRLHLQPLDRESRVFPMRRVDAGAPAAPPARYDSLADFYSADESRIDSRELDVGLWWREDADGPLHRAAWIKDTGELYLVRLGADSAGGGRVEVLARVDDRALLERVLDGWRERCGEPRSLAWLRERARRLGGRTRATPARPAAAIAGRGARLAPAGRLALR